MENVNGTIIIGIILGACLGVLFVVKIAEFFTEFKSQTRYLLCKLRRACDDGEYRYWLRELRCHYLCLIPFVTECNVRWVYSFMFYKPKHNKKENRSDGILHILAQSVICIAVCAVCLCGTSWAWFSASASIETIFIQSPSYVLYKIDSNNAETELTDAGNTYTLTSDAFVITLKAIGTTGATGYCSVMIGDKTYYTDQIIVSEEKIFTFSIEAPAGTEIMLIPKWGICAERDDANTIPNNGIIFVSDIRKTAASIETSVLQQKKDIPKQ